MFHAPRRSSSCLLPLAILLATGVASAQTLARISADAGGVQANDISSRPSMTPDGRFIAFYSEASNLVPGDTNLVRDIFVFDRLSRTIERVSVSSTGVQGNGKSSRPRITADGRYVTFYSDSTNLVAGDTNLARDVFVHDRQTGATVRVSVSTAGVQGNGLSTRPTISGDGRFVAFASDATNLQGGDLNLARDVFLHDRDLDGNGVYDEAGGIRTVLFSRSSAGLQGNADSSIPRISADGRCVSFRSIATNLVALDTNGSRDVFVREVLSGTTVRVSVSTSGAQASGDSSRPTISGDGRFIAFNSDASNLVPGDTNQHCILDPFGQMICSPATDCFVRDRDVDGNGIFDEPGGVATIRVSTSSAGLEGNDRSEDPEISANGRFVAFWTEATNLFPGDTNGIIDAVVHDRDVDGNGVFDEAGGVATSVVSASTAGVLGNGGSKRAVVSDNGKFVAFRSLATNLVAGDTNLVQDVFVRGDCPVTRFGASTPACAGPQAIDLPFCAIAGESGTLTCTNVPPLTFGFLVVSFGSFPPGFPFQGVSIFLDPTAPFFLFLASADLAGNGSATFPPTPANAVGAPISCQFLWFNTPTCAGTGKFSASDALSTVLQ